MQTTEQQTWYAPGKTSAPHHQGLVCDEATGKTVAVTYDDEGGRKARLMAEAPAMADLLQRVAEHFADTDAPLGEQARAILARIDGEDA